MSHLGLLHKGCRGKRTFLTWRWSLNTTAGHAGGHSHSGWRETKQGGKLGTEKIGQMPNAGIANGSWAPRGVVIIISVTC